MLTIKKIVLKEPICNEENVCSLGINPLNEFIPKFKKPEKPKPKPNQINQPTNKNQPLSPLNKKLKVTKM